MKICEIAEAVNGEIVCCSERAEDSIDCAFASDLMSDVLTLKLHNFMLITGLSNIQSVRTAEMSDLQYVLIVRNKNITLDMIELAKESGIVLIRSPFSLFKASGVLYEKGLKPVY